MFVIKWTNRFSQETGYVKSISKKAGHFVNTYEETEAKTYARQTTAEKAVRDLIDIGEAENNYFAVQEV